MRQMFVVCPIGWASVEWTPFLEAAVPGPGVPVAGAFRLRDGTDHSGVPRRVTVDTVPILRVGRCRI